MFACLSRKMGREWLFYRPSQKEAQENFRGRITAAGLEVESSYSAGVSLVFDHYKQPSVCAVVLRAAADMEAAQETLVSLMGKPFRQETAEDELLMTNRTYLDTVVFPEVEKLSSYQPTRFKLI